MTTPLVLIGGGGHARVVAEAARSRGVFDVVGYVDPQRCEDTERLLGLTYLGGDEWIKSHNEVSLILAVGALGRTARRREMVGRLGVPDSRWATIVHADACVSPTASIAAGAVVFAGVVVQSGVRLGLHTIVNTGALVDHDVSLGDYAQLAPGAVVGGGTSIGTCAFIGLGARVRDHIRIGDEAIVGMGSVVLNDVASRETVVGVPAVPLRRELQRA